MKNRLTIEFNHAEERLEDIVKITILVISKYSDHVEKAELVPTDKKVYRVSLDGKELLNKATSRDVTMAELEDAVEEEIQAKGKIDCFGWGCSDVLRKIVRD